ncbi:ShlB/FhaC/HecB family hemolysin secretion/activation protein [Planktothricoides sp. FACHB-1370]|uniref:ShlB/FhaC/HecB family hemolysin secretion/activation protein n=2 Tax=Planktothricoides raciborskii TaxID=132608 RepID=A0ABR8EIY1_9CYAN|nr:ShlB/FhaC/HecB family hemolysin secretion/activation protein [Planktothricoides raciborskii FACHB-1370]MBD2585306.1 ShlB/FhaC/HecB family hemolysin secretion/activation protein [Planktothricoides raciborskii FACHB-1261]
MIRYLMRLVFCGVFMSISLLIFDDLARAEMLTNLSVVLPEDAVANQPDIDDNFGWSPEEMTSNWLPVFTGDDSLELSDISFVSFDSDRPIIDQNLTQNYITQNPPAPPLNPQPDPNRDRFPQPIPEPEPTSPEEEENVLPEPTPTEIPLPTESSEQFLVKKIEIVTSTVLTEAEIQQLVAPLEGNYITVQQLKEVADTITQIYLDRGYITSRAFIPDQTLDQTGIVRINIIEGVLEDVQVEGNRRINPSYIKRRIFLGASSPLNTALLEDKLRLLRLNPIFENVEASLRAGSEIGKSVLLVRIKEASPFVNNFSVDNLSPPSVGSQRAGITLGWRNVTGWGDDILGSFYISDGDSQVYDFSYRVPVNAMNGTVQLRVAPNRNGIVQDEFEELEIRGNSELYELSFRQPLARSPREEFALSLALAHQTGQTFTFQGPTPFGLGPDEDGISRTSVIKFGQDYIRRDVQGAWSVRSQFTLGTGWLNATVNPDPIPDGRFFSWTGQLQRVQRLNNNHLLIIQGDLQLTPNSLLSSQQFVIGGGSSLRGYRQNVRSGDNGFRFSVEDRITVIRNTSNFSILQVAPFVDMGSIWNHGDNPNPLPDEQFLVGIGAGVLWQVIPGLNMRLDYARPLISIDDKGDNLQDEGFYFTVNYGF